MKVNPLVFIAAAGALAACSDSTSTESHAVTVGMQQTDVVLLVAPIAESATSALGKVPVSDVDSLFLTFTSVSFRPVGADDDSTGGGWQSFMLPAPVTVDLLALPSESDSAVVMAAGTLVEGDYEALRFLVSDGSIYFNTTITIGNSTFDPDTEYEVTVPSGSTSGLKTDLSFSVSDSAQVNLLFSTTATLDDVTATGSGKVILKPVFKAKNGS